MTLTFSAVYTALRTASATGTSPFTRFHCLPTVAGLVEHGGQDRGDVGPRDVTPSDVRTERDQPGRRVVGEPARADDRPVQVVARRAASASRLAST